MSQIDGNDLAQINGGNVPNAQVSAKEFAAKFQSKRECYVFLAQECDIYLPPYGTCWTRRRLILFS